MKSKTTSATTFKILFSRLLYCIIIFTSFIMDARAQVVNANLIITPPYSVYFRDYSGYGKTNNILLSVISNTNRRVYLAGSVTKDDNSIVISVKNSYRPLTPILLTANTPLMLNGLQLRKVYGDGTTDDLNLTGVTANDIGLNQALPEGSYTFCIKVKDYDTREVISTACKTIFVTYYNPPQFINPFNGTSVQGFNPQMMMVTWQNTAPQVFGITYRLKMVKLIKGITALDALNNNVQLILDKGNLITTNYPLDVSSGIKLEAGQIYAMQVIAQSPTAYFKNGGKSEVTTFFYKGANPVIKVGFLNPVAQKGKDTIKVNNDDPFSLSWSLYKDDQQLDAKKYGITRFNIKLTPALNPSDKKPTDKKFSFETYTNTTNDLTSTITQKKEIVEKWGLKNGNWYNATIIGYDKDNKIIVENSSVDFLYKNVPENVQLGFLNPVKGKDTLKANNEKAFALSWSLFKNSQQEDAKKYGITRFHIQLTPALNPTAKKPADKNFTAFETATLPNSTKELTSTLEFKREIAEKTMGLKNGYWYNATITAYDKKNKVIVKNSSVDFLYKNIADNNKFNTLKISGKAQYSFKREQYMNNGKVGFMTKDKFILTNTNLELIQVMLIVPVYNVKKIVGEEGGKFIYENVDSIPTVMDYSSYGGALVANTEVAGKPETKGAGTVIARAITDEAGNYSFDIVNNFTSETILTGYGNDEGTGQKMAAVKALRIHVASDYYYDDLTFYYPKNNSNLFNQSTIVQAKQYQTKVLIEGVSAKLAYYTNKLIPSSGKYNSNADIYLLRKNNITNNPPPTGNMNTGNTEMKIGNTTYYVIAKKNMPLDASVTFIDMVENLNPGVDDYYVYAALKGVNTSFSPQKISYKTDCYYFCNEKFAEVPEEQKSKIHEEKIVLMPFQSSVGITGKLKYFFANKDGTPNTNTGKILANTAVKLVLQAVIKPTGSSVTYPVGKGETLDAGVTDGDGVFTFSVGNLGYNSLGSDMNDYKDATGSYTDKDGVRIQVTGKKYFVLRIQVQSPYYYSPDNDFLVQDGYDYEVGTLKAYVREADASYAGVRAVNPDIEYKVYGGIGSPIKKSGERVYLCINPKYFPADFPIIDSKIFNLSKKEIISDGVTYKVIDETISGIDGKVSFKNMVLSDPDKGLQSYYMFTESATTSQDNYSSNNMQNMSPLRDVKIDYNGKEVPTDYSDKRYNFQKNYMSRNSSLTMYTFAQAPYIFGAVYPESNYSTDPLGQAKVEMYDIPTQVGDLGTMEINDDNLLFLKTIVEGKITPNRLYTGGNGKFEYKINTQDGDKTKTYRKLLVFSHFGFIDKIVLVNGGKPMISGQRAALNKIYLNLPKQIFAEVRDEETNEFVPAKVVVGDNYSWGETKEEYVIIKKGNGYETIIKSQKLALLSSTGNTNFKVYPKDNDSYLGMYISKAVTKEGIGKFVFLVKKRKHKIYIQANSPAKKNVPVKATVINVNPHTESTSGEVTDQGIPVQQAQLEFASASKIFTIRIEAINGGYQPKVVSVWDDGIVTKKINYELTPAKNITVRVTHNDNPVPGATVYIDELEQTAGTTRTDKSGTATIKYAPTSGTYNIVVTPVAGSGQTNTLLGVTQKVDVADLKNNSLEISLDEFQAFSVNTLLGFPMEVKALRELNGRYFVNARLKISNGNNIFKINSDDNNYVEIDNVEIKKIGNSFGPPTTIKDIIFSTTNEKKVTAFNNYNAIALLPAGLRINKTGDESGVIRANVMLENGAFEKGITFSNKDNEKPYLRTPDYNNSGNETEAEIINLFNNTNNAPSSLTNSFKISAKDLKVFKYRLHNRYQDAEATVAGSSFDAKGLHLNTILHTKIAQLFARDINLAVGVIDFTNNSVSDLSGKTPLTFPMDKWKFVTNSWRLDAEGFIVNGNIQAGPLNVPAKDVLIGYDKFDYGTYDINNIKLGNLPMTLTENTSVSFGYDEGFGSNGAWSLSMLPGANSSLLTSFANLPSLGANDKIDIKGIALYSNGEDFIGLSDNTPAVTLFGVSKYRPSTAWITPGSINFRGAIDLAIPKLSEISATYDLRYETKNNQLVLGDLPGFNALSFNTKGIKVEFSGEKNTQVFKEGSLQLKGKLTDQDDAIKYGNDKNGYDVTLTKTSMTDTKIMVDENKNQKFIYTNVSGMEKIKGEMKVLNDIEWDNFKFEGDLYGEGYEDIAANKRHLSFVVKGDLVADGQSVGVNNVAVDGLGTGSITYDFKQKALLGTMHVEQELPTYHLSSDLELKLGGGEWYLFAAGEATNIQNMPVKSFKIAFYAGKGSITPNMQNVFRTFFYKNELPELFPIGNYTGALMAGSIKMPIPKVPEVDVNLSPVVKIVVEHSINGNLYMGLNFDGKTSTGEKGLVFNIGGQVYVYVHLGAAASVGLACMGADFKGTVGASLEGEAAIPMPPNASLTAMKESFAKSEIKVLGKIWLTLTGSAYVGGGLCDSDCDGYFCASVSVTKAMEVEYEVMGARTKDGFIYDLHFNDFKFK